MTLTNTERHNEGQNTSMFVACRHIVYLPLISLKARLMYDNEAIILLILKF